MKYKQFVAGFAICLILLSAIFITGFAEGFTVLPNPYPITLNGAEISVEAYNINGFTFLKLADVGKAIPGTTIKFNEIDEAIEINSVEASLPETIDESEVMSMSTAIEYDLVTGLPAGAEYVEYKGCNTAIEYNENVYLSLADLSSKFGIKSKSIDVKTNTTTFAKDNNIILADLRISGNHFLSSTGKPFYNINLFAELIGE